KITRCFPVDSYDGQIAVIAACANLRLRDDIRYSLRLRENFGREDMWQVVLADNDLHIHAEVVLESQNFDHAAVRALRRGWPLRYLDVYHHAIDILMVGASRFFANDAMQ